MTELSQFLIVFNHERGALHQDVTVFADPAEALRAYDAAERHFAQRTHIEVVLIGSDSLDTVRRTHATTSMAPPPWNASYRRLNPRRSPCRQSTERTGQPRPSRAVCPPRH
jgi:hypothetical protein